MYAFFIVIYLADTLPSLCSGNISIFDLWETYLPQYERAFRFGGAAGTMCSYMSVRIGNDGNATPAGYVPSCANEYLLSEVVRSYWGRPDATHLTDCGALANMADQNHFTTNYTLAAGVQCIRFSLIH